MGACAIQSAVLSGVEARPVTVEVSVGSGLPGMSIVGMADTAVKEAQVRVRASIKAAGFAMPGEKVVVNLAPGNLKKTGSGFDLPIAFGILVATGQISEQEADGRLFVGELSLQGNVRPVIGSLAFAVCAKKLGCELITALQEPAPIQGLMQRGISGLGMLHLNEPFVELTTRVGSARTNDERVLPDYKDIAGHDIAKRALQIAAAGQHGLLMMGPPGSGKTMLASRLVSILPPLTEDERMEAAVVHSVAGEDVHPILSGVRPFRNPHHSATTAGLLGGGNPIRPGEISLAHCGVLFLDELSEFRPSTLQSLRQPLESGCVFLTRAEASIRLPAHFMLVAASNPCPCGYAGDKTHACTCTSGQIRRYQGKIGGPLIDRIAMRLDVERLSTSSVLSSGQGTDSATLKDGVLRAREYAAWRRARASESGERDEHVPGSPSEVIASCALDEGAQRFVNKVAEGDALSGRSLINTLKVARTVADIDESAKVTEAHLAEAFALRIDLSKGEQGNG